MTFFSEMPVSQIKDKIKMKFYVLLLQIFVKLLEDGVF
jgi:hypothetical protein